MSSWAENRGAPAGGFQHSLALIVSTLAISVMSLALPIATTQIYDRILPNESGDTLLVLTGGVLAAILLEFLLRTSRAYLIGWAGAAFVHRESCRALARLLEADFARDSRSSSQASFQALGAVRSLKDFRNGYALTAMIELALLPVFLWVIFYIAGALVLVPAATVGLLVAYSLLIGYVLKKALTEREASDEKRYNFLIGVLTAIHSVKSFAQEDYLQRRYETLQTRSCSASFGVASALSSGNNASAVFSQAMLVAIVGIGAIEVTAGRLSVGALIAVVLLSGRVMQPVQRALLLWSRYQNYTVAKSRVDRLMALPRAIDDDEVAPKSAEGAIDINGLSFGYGGGAPLIEDLNLSLRRGQAISISGATGSGKTTLLQLIAALHRPTKGTILLDGVETTRIPRGRINRHVGFLSSDGVIFRGTIRDNISRFGDVPLAQAMEVAALLGCEREFAKLPAGLDTMLEGTGVDSIPPGVKQRISIIRALAAKPRAILFDNADRALDADGYDQIFTLLGRLRRKTSMVIVSDDENLRQLADRHFELESGRLYELSNEAGRAGMRFRNVRL